MVVVSEAVNGKTILDCIDSSSPGATQCASVIRDIVPAIESIVVEFALNQGDVPGLKEKLSNYVIDYASYLESDDGESWRPRMLWPWRFCCRANRQTPQNFL